MGFFSNIGDFKQEVLTPPIVSGRELEEQQNKIVGEHLHTRNTNRIDLNATFTNQGELTSTEEENSESESTESKKEVEDEEVRYTSRAQVSNIAIMTAQGNQIENNGGCLEII